ncbi:MAG: transporter substrate-binding domain-containing protein [Deltaproteobacteria bacterium]|nr:transporter substrate-binding domain-containing protein [Deltaproteobacteria bacterium]
MKWIKFTLFLAACFVFALLDPAAPPAGAGEEFAPALEDKWTGDFDGMVKHRTVRVLVTYNKMMFFLDRGRYRGATHDAFLGFEEFLNKKLKTGTLKVKVIFIPVTRDRILPALVEGLGDIAAANLTITPERLKNVAFSDPFLTDVSEIVVTGPAGPKLTGLDDLAGREVYVRKSSSYYESLLRLNESLMNVGKKPVKLVPADELLEDSDLLEMVNAGLVPVVVVDNHKAEFWRGIFDKITLHPGVSVNTGGEIAWAFRKGNPKLKAVVNEFVKGHKKGTLMGNIILKRYLKENKWARNATSPEELKKFNQTVDIFKKYADQYGFDYLITVALAYQESTLDHTKRSKAGAVGIMQVLPSTAADKNVGIPEVENLESNIHAGTKYLRFIRNRYFSDPAIDGLNQTLFAFASYNAGPAKVARLRKEAKEMGLNPNVWFNNVEEVAAKRIGRETVQYVSNIYKYYIAYRLIFERRKDKEKVKKVVSP